VLYDAKDKEILDAVVERYLDKTLDMFIRDFEMFGLGEKDVLESIMRLAKERQDRLCSKIDRAELFSL